MVQTLHIRVTYIYKHDLTTQHNYLLHTKVSAIRIKNCNKMQG